MVLFTFLVATIIFTFAITSGFELRAHDSGSIMRGMPVSIYDNKLVFNGSGKPVDFEFRKGELGIVGTNKFVIVLKDGSCLVSSKKYDYYSHLSPFFDFKDGFLSFNEMKSYVHKLNNGISEIRWDDTAYRNGQIMPQVRLYAIY